MNLITDLVGAILAVICILPFVLMIRNSKKLEKQLLESLSGIAAQQNSTITQHELCGNIAIGLDENTHTFFFFKRGKNTQTAQHIDLGKFQNCTVVNTRRSFKVAGRNDSVIEKLELSFLPIVKNKSPLKLEFYNSDESRQLNGELQLVEKWSKILNGKLQKTQQVSQVA